MTSKRRLRRKQCGQKVAYPSGEQAIAMASRLRARDGAKMRAYRCRWCKHWHVGHMPKLYDRP